jgi:hypothetical protein
MRRELSRVRRGGAKGDQVKPGSSNIRLSFGCVKETGTLEVRQSVSSNRLSNQKKHRPEVLLGNSFAVTGNQRRQRSTACIRFMKKSSEGELERCNKRGETSSNSSLSDQGSCHKTAAQRQSGSPSREQYCSLRQTCPPSILPSNTRYQTVQIARRQSDGQIA